MAKTWEPGLAIITRSEDWDRAIMHLWGDSINEFKRAFPHLFPERRRSRTKVYTFPNPDEAVPKPIPIAS